MVDLNIPWTRAQALLDGGEALSTLDTEINAAAAAALEARATGLISTLGEQDVSANRAMIAEAVRWLAVRADAADGTNDTPIDFEDFRAKIEDELAGIVFTAHPTFALGAEARDRILDRVSGKSVTFHNVGDLQPVRSPTLEEEYDQAGAATLNIRRAMRTALLAVFDVAEAMYPEHWRSLVPQLVTVATWVGFDLDGRTDIGWVQSQRFRYRLAFDGLEELGETVGQLPALDDAGGHLASLKEGLATFVRCFRAGSDALEAAAEAGSDFAELNRTAMANRGHKETAMRQIDAALDGLMAGSHALDALKAIAVLRAEWRTFGLGLAHIHFRVNAAQLHNAIRPEIALTREPDQSSSRRHYLKAVSDLLDRVEPQNVHYGVVAHEMTTAKRVFMLAAQFEKHFDGRTPIRMLVAESDTAFTVLAALYYARLFDVADHVEISPLFETDIGLQRGDQVIAELLENPHFCAYVRGQGRFCVQLGFSDSGRYIGQLAAGLAIERFKLRLVRLWEKSGMGDVQLVFFDTHGESIGRGTHPLSLRDRFLYTHTPAVRRAARALEAAHKHEVSFQGGDGYMWFASEASALAVLTQFLRTRLSTRPNAPEDPFYAESGWALDFFLTLRERQEAMADHPGYVALIDSIGRNLLYPTGSRASKRQGRGAHAPALESISQLRAIPNNATLHQLGYLANSMFGLAHAIRLSPDMFERLHTTSSRLKRLMSLAREALKRSSVTAAYGYLNVMRPDPWLRIAEASTDSTRRGQIARLSMMLEERFDQRSMARLMRDWKRDGLHREDLVRDNALDLAVAPDAALMTLHGLRLTLIQFIYMKAMEVPRFSTRLDISLDDVLDELLHLDVPEALAQLRKIFPAADPTLDAESYGEEATYEASRGGYRDLHERILDPIETAYRLIHKLSAVIALRVGAFG